MSIKTCDDDLTTLGDLFIAEDARPDHLTPALPDALPAFARVLLVTDGTVTHMLRAHFREPVEVRVEGHEFVVAGNGGFATQKWLETPDGTDILIRDVVLVGETSGRLFARARSFIALDRLAPEMCEDIIAMRRSIGNVLLAHFSENRRELLWHGLRQDERENEASEQTLERTYRVIAGGKPLMVITETFAPLILENEAPDTMKSPNSV